MLRRYEKKATKVVGDKLWKSVAQLGDWLGKCI